MQTKARGVYPVAAILPLTSACGCWAGWLQSDEARVYSAFWAFVPTLACTRQPQGWLSTAHGHLVVLVCWPPARLKADPCPSPHLCEGHRPLAFSISEPLPGFLPQDSQRSKPDLLSRTGGQGVAHVGSAKAQQMQLPSCQDFQGQEACWAMPWWGVAWAAVCRQES